VMVAGRWTTFTTVSKSECFPSIYSSDC
jgi:hypothetical protein